MCDSHSNEKVPTSSPHEKRATALHMAVLNKWLEGVQTLLYYGADPNSINHEGYTPLMLSVNLHRTSITLALLMSPATNLLLTRKGCHTHCTGRLLTLVLSQIDGA